MQLEQFWTTFHMPLLPSHDPKGMDLFGKQSAYGWFIDHAFLSGGFEKEKLCIFETIITLNMMNSPLKQGLEFILWINREATAIEFIIHVMPHQV